MLALKAKILFQVYSSLLPPTKVRSLGLLCCKVPQIGWLKGTAIGSVPAWRLESKTGVQAGLVPSGGSGVGCAPYLCPSFRRLPVALGVPWLVETSLQSLSPSSHGSAPMSLSKVPSFPEDTNHTGLRSHPNPARPHLTSATSAKTLLFLNKVTVTGLVG